MGAIGPGHPRLSCERDSGDPDFLHAEKLAVNEEIRIPPTPRQCSQDQEKKNKNKKKRQRIDGSFEQLCVSTE